MPGSLSLEASSPSRVGVSASDLKTAAKAECPLPPKDAGAASDEGEVEEALLDGGAHEDASTAVAAKKKKKSKKKKASGGGAASGGSSEPQSLGYVPSGDNSHLRLLGNWPEVRPSAQTVPASVRISDLFPDGNFPRGKTWRPLLPSPPLRDGASFLREGADGGGLCVSGEVQLYAKSSADAAGREADLASAADLEAFREAAECHRQVRRFAQSICKPGVSLTWLCQQLEAKTLMLSGAASSSGKLERGRGFPTGCSVNECAAHFTPNPQEDYVLKTGDICKLDFGVQVRGRIIDCAFSIAFDSKFDPLIQATQDGTNVGLREAGADARISEIAALIEEAISSYEMDVLGNGVSKAIKPIRNLTGHTIAPYRIHGGKAVPLVKGGGSGGAADRMEEGEVFAIETFASTGRGVVSETGDCSHFMKNFEAPFVPLRLKSARDLLRLIDDNFGTLAFCRRWLNELGCENHQLPLQQLVSNHIVVPYPPLSDVVGSFTSQMEHTVYIGATGKEVLSRGDDF